MKIEGLDELKKKIAAMGEKVGGRALRNAARAAMLPAEKAAKAAAPKGTEPHWIYKNGKRHRLVGPGFAARSIRRVVRRGGDKHNVVVKLSTTREGRYALFHETGTDKLPAKPWLVRSFESSQDEVLKRFKERLRAAIEKHAKS